MHIEFNPFAIIKLSTGSRRRRKKVVACCCVRLPRDGDGSKRNKDEARVLMRAGANRSIRAADFR
jgi:hypothetical protein